MEVNYDIFGSVIENDNKIIIENMTDLDNLNLDDLESEIGLIEDDIEEEVVSSETEVIDPEFQGDIGFSEVDTPVPAGDDVETFESLHLHNENLIFSADGSGDSIPKNENIDGNEIQENFASRPICWTRMPKGCRNRFVTDSK